MKIKKTLMTIAICFFVAFSMGCEPTIDASSEEAFDQSIEEMTEGMTEDEEMEFALGLMGLMFHYAEEHDGDEDAAMEELDGLSVSDIESLLEELDDEFE